MSGFVHSCGGKTLKTEFSLKRGHRETSGWATVEQRAVARLPLLIPPAVPLGRFTRTFHPGASDLGRRVSFERVFCHELSG